MQPPSPPPAFPMPAPTMPQLPMPQLHVFRIAVACLMTLWIAGCSTVPSSSLPDRQRTQIGLDGSLRLAGAALAGGDIDSALRLYRGTVRDHPKAPAAHQGLADAYYAIRAFPEAKAAYSQLATLQPNDVATPLGLGRVALASGAPTTALEHFQHALTLDPDNMQAQNGLAVAMDLSGDHTAAQAIYHALLKQDPANRAVSNNLALSLALSGKLEQAIDSLAELAGGPTIMPHARHNLALAYALQGNETSAQALIRQDLSRDAVDDTLAFYRRLRSAEPSP